MRRVFIERYCRMLPLPKRPRRPPGRGRFLIRVASVPNDSLVIARAQQLQEIADEQHAKANRSDDQLTREVHTAAANAYSNWACEIEQIARTIESIQTSAHAATQRTIRDRQSPPSEPFDVQ